MEAAWGYIGVKETAGKGATAEIVGMYAKAGHAEVSSDEVPWCAAFVGGCLKDASLPNTGSLLARSYLEYGTKLDAPKVGAIAIFKRGAPPSGHVAFVTGWGNGSIRVLGGNQGDKVCEANYPLDSLLGLRWPPQKATAPAAAPKPLLKSRKLWNTITGGGLLAFLSDWVGQVFSVTTAAATQFAALAPSRDLLATVGGNGQMIAIAVGVGCLVSAVAAGVDDHNKRLEAADADAG
jgi:uncharacterized protein (TIGR02594 family)